ncbi:MAG: hypothetical protein ACKV19_00935 [Verrucomicrobiales bacterium]
MKTKVINLAKAKTGFMIPGPFNSKSKCYWLGGLVVALVLSSQNIKSEDAESPQSENRAAPSRGLFAPEDTDLPQHPDDPFVTHSGGRSAIAERIPITRGKEERISFRVRVEVWEVEAKTLAAKLDENLTSDDLMAWRATMMHDDAARLVHSPVVVVEEKSRASAESGLERIYAVENEPPEVGSPALESPRKPIDPDVAGFIESVLAHATPTAFETRETGTQIEVAVQPVAVDPALWDLALSFEEVRLVAMETQGAETLGIKQPAMSVFRTGGLFRIKEGGWHVVSAQEPPRALDGEPTGNRWLTLVRIDRIR